MSIRKQLTVIFVGMISAMFLANYLLNTFLLEDFYYMRKQRVLLDAYELLNENITDVGRLPEETKEELNEICTSNIITLLVTDSNYNVKIWNNDVFVDQALRKVIVGRLNGYRIGLENNEGATVLETTDSYTIQRKYDEDMGVEYLEMWGELGKGFNFMMRFNVEGIQESVRVSSEFIKYICLTGIVLTVIIVLWVSKWVTRPLHELTELSKRMADLDFDVKYTSGGKNEIGQLGKHFNQMSENLEKAYSQLMTANNELQKDIEKKEKIDNMRKEFLSNVSHELKTPIALIQGYAEGLAECVNDDAESREFYCEVIMDEAGKMNNMVQKLLTLNQLEFGNDQVVVERFDIVTLIRNKIQSVSILADQKEAAITYQGSDTAPVWGDEFKIEEVLTNYLSNALNHVEGERRIQVRTEQTGEIVRVSVFNTGETIPEDDIGQIWDKFYKVDKARTREYGGSGVGLSIVRAIMEAHHQRYGVKNRADGVEFWFELRNGNMPAESEEKQDFNGELPGTEDVTPSAAESGGREMRQGEEGNE